MIAREFLAILAGPKIEEFSQQATKTIRQKTMLDNAIDEVIIGCEELLNCVKSVE